jgi:hypothetical protein
VRNTERAALSEAERLVTGLEPSSETAEGEAGVPSVGCGPGEGGTAVVDDARWRNPLKEVRRPKLPSRDPERAESSRRLKLCPKPLKSSREGDEGASEGNDGTSEREGRPVTCRTNVAIARYWNFAGVVKENRMGNT